MEEDISKIMEQETAKVNEQKYNLENRVFFAKNEVTQDIAGMLYCRWGKPQRTLYPGDNTIQADIDVDDRAIELLKSNKYYKDDCILTEERAKKGEIINPESKYKWIMDLLDGSSNYNSQIPVFATSIAIEKSGSIDGSVIYAPMSKQLFYAIRGKGAFSEDKSSGIHKQMQVSNTKELKNAKISTVSLNSYKKHGLVDLLQKIQDSVKSTAQLGCTSLEFAYTALGSFDGIIKPTKNPWGVEAGLLMVPEAGGKLTTFKKDKLNIHVASNPYIHDALCRIVEDYLEEKKE